MKENKISLVVALFLGATSLVGATATVNGALTMGVAVVAVLLISSLIKLVLKKMIAGKIEIAANIVIYAFVTTLVAMLLNAFMSSGYKLVSLYIAVLAVDLLVWTNGEKLSFKDTVLLAVKFFGALVVIGAVRELLGKGSFYGIEIPFLAKNTITVLASVPGGFMVTAFVMAIFNKEPVTKLTVNDLFTCKKEAE